MIKLYLSNRFQDILYAVINKKIYMLVELPSDCFSYPDGRTKWVWQTTQWRSVEDVYLDLIPVGKI